MNKDIGKRLGCAALATQMLLSPVAQAAIPLRESFDSTVNAPVGSLAENRLTGQEKNRLFRSVVERVAYHKGAKELEVVYRL